LDRQKQQENTEHEYLKQQLYQSYKVTSEWLKWSEENEKALRCLPGSSQEQLASLTLEAARASQHYQAYLRFLSPSRPSAPQVIKLHLLFAELAEHFRPRAKKKNLTFITTANEALEAFGQWSELWSILYLCFDFLLQTAPSGSIKISGSSSPGKTLITLKNSGFGLNSRQVQRLRSQDNSPTLPPSLLWVEVTQVLCAKIGAQFTITSDFHQGTCLRLSLPSSDAAPQPQATLPKEAPRSRLSILLIDPHRERLKTLCACLSKDYYVTTALGGPEGFSQWAQGHYEAVVALVDMPQIDGPMVLEGIRQTHSRWELPVILLSENPESDDSLRLLELGANVLLPLPINLHNIQTHLRNLTRSQAEFKERFVPKQPARTSKTPFPLAEGQKQFTRLICPNPEPILLFDRFGKIVQFSEAWPQRNGSFSKQDLGVPISGSFPWDWSFVQQEAPDSPQAFGLQVSVQAKATIQRFELLVLPLETGDVALRRQADHPLPVVRVAELLSVVVYPLEPATWRDYANWPSLSELVPLGNWFTTLENSKTNSPPGPHPKALQFAVVDLMVHCVDLWEANTGLSRLKLAELSGLWRVHQDNQGAQRAKTLTRYLSLQRVPKRPRIEAVLGTANFVISYFNTQRLGPLGTLEAKLDQLQEYLAP